MTSDITVIGLGAMGSSLARALLKAGRSVTVWNRSSDKMEPLVALGAYAATDLSEAITASPRSVVCLLNYTTTTSLFADPKVEAALVSRNIIQLGTSSPQESEDS